MAPLNEGTKTKLRPLGAATFRRVAFVALVWAESRCLTETCGTSSQAVSWKATLEPHARVVQVAINTKSRVAVGPFDCSSAFNLADCKMILSRIPDLTPNLVVAFDTTFYRTTYAFVREKAVSVFYPMTGSRKDAQLRQHPRHSW